MVAQAIANGGVVMNPYVVDHVLSPEGASISTTQSILNSVWSLTLFCSVTAEMADRYRTWSVKTQLQTPPWSVKSRISQFLPSRRRSCP
jgi:membrane peptidoglycan carboxypeptidase